MTSLRDQPGRYEIVNGLKIYYEIHGSGRPLVLLHGGGSTIQSKYGLILPELSKSRQVIAIELQAHPDPGHKWRCRSSARAACVYFITYTAACPARYFAGRTWRLYRRNLRTR